MGKASRAIIVEGDKLLVMYRDKSGSQYATLVGGRVNEGESLDQALVREVKEETGLEVKSSRLVFIEEHKPPYNEQYIYLVELAPHDAAAIQATSEEGLINRIGINLHEPRWVEKDAFGRLSFRTPQLQQAIIDSLHSGFPEQPKKL